MNRGILSLIPSCSLFRILLSMCYNWSCSKNFLMIRILEVSKAFTKMSIHLSKNFEVKYCKECNESCWIIWFLTCSSNEEGSISSTLFFARLLAVWCLELSVMLMLFYCAALSSTLTLMSLAFQNWQDTLMLFNKIITRLQ